MFIAALFKLRKQPKWSTIDESIKKMWYIYHIYICDIYIFIYVYIYMYIYIYMNIPGP
jgi:hypothetical protein